MLDTTDEVLTILYALKWAPLIRLPYGSHLLLAQTLPSVSASADISPLSGEYPRGKANMLELIEVY